MLSIQNSLKTTTGIALLTLGTIFLNSEGTLAATLSTNGERSLQVLLDEVTGGQINAVDDQSDVELWTVNSEDFDTTLLFEIAGDADVNRFGIYKKDDITKTLELFSGPDQPTTNGSTQISVLFNTDGSVQKNSGNSPLIADFGTEFGFYLQKENGRTFYTEDLLNRDGSEQAVVYQGYGNEILGENDWIIAFEDLLATKKNNDRDYNDFVVRATDLSGVIPVPEASTLLGLGLFAASVFHFRRRQH